MINLKRVVVSLGLLGLPAAWAGMWLDSRLNAPAPPPPGIQKGARVPSFNLPTVDGGKIPSDQFSGKLWILTFASCSCPLSPDTAKALRAVQDEWGQEVPILSVYTREAHPNTRFPQTFTFNRSLSHARTYVRTNKISWPVAIDATSGQFHHAMGGMPNGSYVIDGRGKIVRAYQFSPDAETFQADVRNLMSVTQRRSPITARSL